MARLSDKHTMRMKEAHLKREKERALKELELREARRRVEALHRFEAKAMDEPFEKYPRVLPEDRRAIISEYDEMTRSVVYTACDGSRWEVTEWDIATMGGHAKGIIPDYARPLPPKDTVTVSIIPGHTHTYTASPATTLLADGTSHITPTGIWYDTTAGSATRIMPGHVAPIPSPVPTPETHDAITLGVIDVIGLVPYSISGGFVYLRFPDETVGSIGMPVAAYLRLLDVNDSAYQRDDESEGVLDVWSDA